MVGSAYTLIGLLCWTGFLCVAFFLDRSLKRGAPSTKRKLAHYALFVAALAIAVLVSAHGRLWHYVGH